MGHSSGGGWWEQLAEQTAEQTVAGWDETHRTCNCACTTPRSVEQCIYHVAYAAGGVGVTIGLRALWRIAAVVFRTHSYQLISRVFTASKRGALRLIRDGLWGTGVLLLCGLVTLTILRQSLSGTEPMPYVMHGTEPYRCRADRVELWGLFVDGAMPFRVSQQ
jgi:hypothetical protein